MGGTRRSGIVSSASDVLGVNMVRGMRGVGETGEMCMCLARGGVDGEWIRGLGMGFINYVETGGVLDVYLCLGCGGVVESGWTIWARICKGGVVLCLCEL